MTARTGGCWIVSDNLFIPGMNTRSVSLGHHIAVGIGTSWLTEGSAASGGTGMSGSTEGSAALPPPPPSCSVGTGT